jgi:hypothetical protein
MKKLALTITAILALLSAQAQITITHDDLPQPGSANIVHYDTTTNVNIGFAQATSQTWDFSNLLNHYPKFAIYSPTAPFQQNAADFPTSNIYTWGPSIFFTSFYGGSPVYTNSWGYMYWKNDTAGFHIVGFRGDCGPGYGYQNVLESPGELLMGSPATYGDQFPDSARWMVKFNKNPFDVDTNYVSVRNKIMNVDAWGTMTTPFGGPYNVLRVHEYITDLDSITASLGTMTYYSVLARRDTLNTYEFWTNGLNYPLAIVHADKNNNVLDVEYLFDTIPCYTVTGNVYDSTQTNLVTAGQASLVIKDSYNHLFNWLETVNIDQNGNFQFADVLGPNFLVRADPDPVQYPYLLPTYYGDKTYWEDGTTLTVDQDTNIIIRCRDYTTLAQQTGPGTISGIVWMDTTQVPVFKLVPTNSTPARGVKVTLVQNPGGACRISTTDQDGVFTFNNLPNASYTIKVDIPGLIQDSTYHIDLNAKSQTVTNLGFKYDTTKIYVYYNTSIDDHNLNSMYDVRVYPNPFTDNATIYVSNPFGENRLVTFKIYDLVGRVVKELSAEDSESINFTSEGMIKGMYIYELQVNHEIISSGKIVVN